MGKASIPLAKKLKNKRNDGKSTGEAPILPADSVHCVDKASVLYAGKVSVPLAKKLKNKRNNEKSTGETPILPAMRNN